MSVLRFGRLLKWTVIVMMVAAGWMALTMAERQLRRLAAAQSDDQGAPETATGALHGGGPVASESGPVGPGVVTTGATGPSGVARLVPLAKAHDKKNLPPGANW